MVQENCIKGLPQLLVVAGATAVGKSSFAVTCGKKYGGVIVGADSMQIYRGLNIGTGKVTEAEKEGILHTMIDIVPPDCVYSVADYVKDAEKVIAQCAAEGKLPILTGGTGFYINALLNGLNFADADKNDAVRERFRKIAEAEGGERLHAMLARVDTLSAKKIAPNDVKRLVRALEIYEVTGTPKSLRVSVKEPKYNTLFIVLNDDREKLYQRIEKRVDRMFEAGLVAEVKNLMRYKECQSMQAIGYKEVVEHLEGKASLEETKAKVKLNSRHYAKRQLTYFRHLDADIRWLGVDEVQKADEWIKNWRN